jgi:DNA-binding transcriptional MerR regulator
MSSRNLRGVTDGTESLTIDELARRVGMTVRNIRAHQSRGLLPPPEVRGRTGYYGDEHVARLELVKELQADGFNLEAIRRLVENAGGSTAEVLRFAQAARTPFEEEEPEVVEVEELLRRFGGAGGQEALDRAVEQGLLRPLGDGRFEERSPRLARVGQELLALGVSIERALDTTKRLHRHADGVAKAYVELFLDEVWRPFDEAGRPAERWPEVQDALDRLRPLAAEALLAMFQLAMTERVDKAAAEVLEQVADERPRSGGRSKGPGKGSARRRR